MGQVSGRRLYCIGNAHLDVVWLWNWQEGFQEIKATFRSALDRMKEYDDFVFSCSSSSYYEWVEQNNPEMFREIQERVREGRWELVGGWITQPDCNIPCGESLVRQALYGQRYFLEKFGKMAITGYNVDTFGHAGTLPQILSKSGLKNYVFLRPMPQEKSLPAQTFCWRAADGSEVLAYRIPYEYNSGRAELDRNVERFLNEFKDGPDKLMLFYGVGNHGGGPTKDNIESIHALNSDAVTLTMSSVAAFFDAIRTSVECTDAADLSVYQGDLQHHASGCYSANSRVKRDNMRAEQALMAAEPWSSVAKALAYLPYPAAELRRGWKNTLFNQFHDILAGTSVPSAYDYTAHSFGEAINLADHALNSAVQALSWDISIDEEAGMRPIVVFNPHLWKAKLPVEFEVRGLADDRFQLLNEDGRPVPAQRIQSEATVSDQSRIVFVADMPALGYRTFRLYSKLDVAPEWQTVPVTNVVLENEFLRVEFNPLSGCIKSLFDKRAGLEVLRRESRLVVIEDIGDTWSHNIFKFDKERAPVNCLSIRKIEEGPVRSSIRVRSSYNDSFITQDFRLYRELDCVETRVFIDWREEHTLLKLKFPLKLNFRRSTYGIPYGFIEKSATGEEEAAQGWIDMSGEHPNGGIYGLSITCDSKYSFSMDIDEMAITLLKNSVYAHHDPKKLESGCEYRFLERGVQEFAYTLFPHVGNWRDIGIAKRAGELKQPLIALAETFHSGSLPQWNCFLWADRDEILINTLKEAEDGDGFILRAVETSGNRVETIVSIPLLKRELPLIFAPCEIKTVKIPYDVALPAFETNMLELCI